MVAAVPEKPIAEPIAVPAPGTMKSNAIGNATAKNFFKLKYSG
jgi:hypothetical protein